MDKGKIIFLNGVTSSGKTCIAKALQDLAEDNFYHISNDTFHCMVSVKFFIENEEKYFAQSIIAMYLAAKAMADKGINIIIDGMLFETDDFVRECGKSNYDMMLETFSGFGVFVVEVFCPLEECRRRNIARGDRGENQSYKQSEIMNKHILYDFTVDTSIDSAEECAHKILQELYSDR